MLLDTAIAEPRIVSMPQSSSSPLAPIARVCRVVASAILAGFRRGLDADAVEARLSRLPRQDQVAIVGATLAGLFLTSVIAAQFGLPGILVFMLAVIALVR
ncbi:MAG: hypothetical protein ACK4TB_04630 [Gemmobacter sp.]